MKQQYRILSLASTRPNPEDAMWVRIKSIAEGLQSKGNEYNIYSFVKYRWSSTKSVSSDHDVIQVSVPSNGLIRMIFSFPEKDYDLVFSNTTYPALIYSARPRFMRRLPLILDLHGLRAPEFEIEHPNRSPLNPLRESLINRLEGRVINTASRIFCVSQKMKEYVYKNFKIAPKIIDFIPNGVNLKHFSPNVDPYALLKLKNSLSLAGKFIVGYYGGMQKWQGVDSLFELAHKYERPSVCFLLMGGTDSWKQGNIIRLPKVLREKLPLYYALSDVFILPRPRHIGTEIAAPTKFAEYCSMGKPIITTDVGDAAELCRQYNCGIVAADNSTNHLSEALNSMLELHEDERKKLGEAARKLAEKEFCWDLIIERVMRAVEEVVEARGC